MAIDIDCDQMPPKAYSAIMAQGKRDFSNGVQLKDNPHLDPESRAAWSEGWQWGSYHFQNKQTVN